MSIGDRFSRLMAMASIALAAAPAMALTSADFAFNPNRFNVFATGDIIDYHSDYQGIAGVAGNFSASGFSLHDVASSGPNTGVSLYAGGKVDFTGAINNGGIEAGGQVKLQSFSVQGNVVAGGPVNIKWGSVTGNVQSAQSVQVNGSGIGGTITQHASFTPTINLNQVSDYFRQASSGFGSISPTGALINDPSRPGDATGWYVQLNSGLNVVQATSAQWMNATALRVVGPADAILVINITDAIVAFDSVTYTFEGGFTRSNILVNLPLATQLTFSGGDHVSILAPNADTTFISGVLTGNLITADLTGSGQVNVGQFNGYDTGIDTHNETPSSPAVPEPISAALSFMSMLAIGVVSTSRRFHPSLK